MTLLPDPILFSFRRCPYAMRARLALAISGTQVELREVDLRSKPASMLVASAKGTVPVLILPDGKVIDESLDIMRWALSNRDPEGWLVRDDAGLIATTDGPFKQHLDGYKYPRRHGGDPLPHREAGMAFLHELDARLAADGQLGGSARGFVDAAIVPFVRQFAAVDQAWFSAQLLSHLKPWLDGHLASNLFDVIMIRTKPWSPNDNPVLINRPASSSTCPNNPAMR